MLRKMKTLTHGFMFDINTHTTKVDHNWNAKRIVEPYTWFQVDIITHTIRIDHNWKVIVFAILCTWLSSKT